MGEEIQSHPKAYSKVLSELHLRFVLYIEFCEASFPAVWASTGVFLQAGFTVDLPTACHFVGNMGNKKADLTVQFVWWCLHKLAVISTSLGSIGSHLLQRMGSNM